MNGSTISLGKNLPAGTTTTVYTVPAGYKAIWTLMYAHNAAGANKYLTVRWYDKSEDDAVYILEQYNFVANTYFQFNGNGSGVVLDEGDEVRTTTETGSTFGIICTFELIQKAVSNLI
jgi:hypothetical protein